MATASRFVASGQVAGIRISTRPDALDDKCLARLQAYGVTTVEIGCQSFNDSVLTAAGRGHTATDSASAVRRCLKAGFQVGVQLMPGLPRGDAVGGRSIVAAGPETQAGIRENLSDCCD